MWILTPDSQVLLSIGIPTIAVLIGILLNTRQNDRLEQHVDAQLASVRSELKADIGALRSEMNARFNAVDARFDAAHQALLRVEGVMDARLKHLEDRE
jgi:hypothetical protein